MTAEMTLAPLDRMRETRVRVHASRRPALFRALENTTQLGAALLELAELGALAQELGIQVHRIGAEKRLYMHQGASLVALGPGARLVPDDAPAAPYAAGSVRAGPDAKSVAPALSTQGHTGESSPGNAGRGESTEKLAQPAAPAGSPPSGAEKAQPARSPGNVAEGRGHAAPVAQHAVSGDETNESLAVWEDSVFGSFGS